MSCWAEVASITHSDAVDDVGRGGKGDQFGLAVGGQLARLWQAMI
jgi:hypothetical protein